MTPTTPTRLAKWRTSHVIKPARDFDEDTGRFVEICGHDGLRIYRRRNGWRHDLAEIKGLAAIERGEGIKW